MPAISKKLSFFPPPSLPLSLSLSLYLSLSLPLSLSILLVLLSVLAGLSDEVEKAFCFIRLVVLVEIVNCCVWALGVLWSILYSCDPCPHRPLSIVLWRQVKPSPKKKVRTKLLTFIFIPSNTEYNHASAFVSDFRKCWSTRTSLKPQPARWHGVR